MGEYFLDLSNDNLDEGKELTAAKEGEYRIRLKDWKTDDDGKIVKMTAEDKPFIMPIFEIINDPDADHYKDMTHFMWLPSDWMDAKKKNSARFELQTFCKAFRIDYHQKIDPENTIGLEADALLVVQDDATYGEQNRVKRFVVSH